MRNDSTLAGFIRHAERFSTGFGDELDNVFEIAAQTLDAVDLGRLSLRMQTIDPKWKLPKDTARELALRLVAEGQDPGWSCRAAGITRRTLQRAQDMAKSAPGPAFQSGENATNQTRATNGSQDPDLSPQTRAA